jgi:L-iditol 2-dehydrogenase
VIAARLHGRGDIRVGDEPARSAGAGESLVRVAAVGICGSDLHWYEDGGIGSAHIASPLIVGHEFAGVVEGGPLDGRLVAVDPAIACEVCDVCRRGDRNLCPNGSFAGYGDTDGGLQEALPWPEHALVELPSSFDAVTGAMLEPLGVALHTFDLGHVALDDRVAVIGCGPIGLLLIQVLRAAGARVVLAVDPLAHRRDAALDCGAARAVTPEDAAGEVDVAFEVAGNDVAVGLALELALPGARVVLAGIPGADDTISFKASVARRKGLSLIMVRRMNEVYPRAIRLVERGAVDVLSLVTHRFPLSRADEAFRVASAREGLKVVVEPR